MTEHLPRYCRETSELDPSPSPLIVELAFSPNDRAHCYGLINDAWQSPIKI
jgi:hypothetical protein